MANSDDLVPGVGTIHFPLSTFHFPFPKVFGEAEDFTVDGSVVSFVYVPTDAEYDNAAGAKEMFEAVQNEYLDYNARVDNGESYMYTVALHPLGYYTQTYGSGDFKESAKLLY